MAFTYGIFRYMLEISITEINFNTVKSNFMPHLPKATELGYKQQK